MLIARMPKGNAFDDTWSPSGNCRSPSISPVQPKHPLAPAPYRGLHHLREFAQSALVIHVPRHSPRMISGDAKGALELSFACRPAEGVQSAKE